MSLRVVDNVIFGQITEESPSASQLAPAWINVLNSIAFFSRVDNLEPTRELINRALGSWTKPLVPSALAADVRKSYPVGARMVMENAAALAAISFPEDRNALEVVVQLEREQSPLYSALTLILVGPYKNCSFETFQNTALAVFDLALMSPLWAVNAEYPYRSVSWDDLHPGYRFFKIARTLLSHKIPPIHDIMTEYEPFLGRVCDTVGFTLPAAIAKSMTMAATSQFRILDQVSHLSSFVEACQLRARVPWAMPFPFIWDHVCGLAGRPSGLDNVCALTALILDGKVQVINEGKLRERLDLQTWKWIAHSLLEGTGLDFRRVDFLGPDSELHTIARDLVCQRLEVDPSSSRTGRGPVLRVSDYEVP